MQSVILCIRDQHTGTGVHDFSFEDYEWTSTDAIKVIRLSDARWCIESQILRSTWEHFCHRTKYESSQIRLQTQVRKTSQIHYYIEVSVVDAEFSRC